MAAKPIRITLVGDDKTGEAFRSAEGNAARFSGTMEKASSISGKALGAIGLGAGGVASAFEGLSQSMDISAATDKLSAQLGLSADESERYGKIAGTLYKQAYGDSIEEVNGAIASVRTSIQGMATATSEDLRTASANAMNLATIFDMDVSEAAASAGNIIKSGLASNATEAFDLMTASLQKVPAAMRGDLLEATNEYGTYLHALGLNGQEAFGLLVRASQGGTIQLDKAGDALKEFSIRSTDMSATSVAAYQKIGLDAQDMSNKILAGGATAKGGFDQIIGGLLGIKDPTEQANTAIALFGTPLEDIGVTKIPAFLTGLKDTGTELGNVQGKAKEAGDALNENSKTTFTEWRRSLETNVTTFIENNVIPSLESMTGKLSETGAAWDIMKVVAVGAMTAIGVAVGVSAALVVLGWASTGIAAVASGATTAMIAGLYVASWITMGVQSLIQAGRMALAWVIALGPIAWVVAAIVGVAILIYKNWDTIVEKTGQAWGWVTEKIGQFVDWWKSVPGKIGAAALGMWDGVKDGFKGALNWIIEKWNNFHLSAKVPDNGITSALGIAGKGFDLTTPYIPPFARGGIAPSGQPILVGEEGPELVTLGQVSRVYTAADTSTMLAGAAAGGSNRPVNINNHVTLNISGTTEQILDVVERKVKSALDDQNRESARLLLQGAGSAR